MQFLRVEIVIGGLRVDMAQPGGQDREAGLDVAACAIPVQERRDREHAPKVVQPRGPLPGQRAPRLHDLRHVFTVSTLLDWYRDGGDVQARLPVLSTWLGHIDPKSTYY